MPSTAAVSARRPRRPALVVGVLLVVAAGLAAGTALATSAGQATPRLPGGRAASPASEAVGPLFVSATSPLHLCTASVVASVHGDLALTAAHCVSGTGAGLVFVPGYRDGRAPFGRFRVVAAWASSRWLTRRDPDRDLAVLELAPLRRGGRTETLQQAVGANALGTAPKPGTPVTVVGYGIGASQPVICRQRVGTTEGFPRFPCPGFVDGTSGGPWLAERSGSAPAATVVGVVGGLHQGGCRSDVSYSAPLGAWAARLLARAEDGGHPSVFPPLGPDGCPTPG